MKQRFNLAGEHQLLGRTGGGNRRLCEMDDLRVVAEILLLPSPWSEAFATVSGVA